MSDTNTSRLDALVISGAAQQSGETFKNTLTHSLNALRADWEALNAAYQADSTPERLAAMRAYDAAINALTMGQAILRGGRTEALNWRRMAQADLRGALTRAGILVGGDRD